MGVRLVFVIHTDKFATTLRLRWSWLQWKEPQKNMGRFGESLHGGGHEPLLCLHDHDDRQWREEPLLGGSVAQLMKKKTKDSAPLIFDLSSKRKWCIHQALNNNAWIGKSKMVEEFFVQHIHQFVDLWTQL